MAINKWVVESTTGRFVYGGFYEPTNDPITQIVVTMPGEQMPNPGMERYDDTSPTLRRPATSAEQVADATSNLNSEATAGIDANKALKAAVICSLWGRLERQPTGAEITAERTRFIAIYKSLS